MPSAPPVLDYLLMASRTAKGLGAPGSPGPEPSPWADDEPTTVAPAIEFTERSGVIPDEDADTVFDDRSVDDIIVGFALGTGADRREAPQRAPSVPPPQQVVYPTAPPAVAPPQAAPPQAWYPVYAPPTDRYSGAPVAPHAYPPAAAYPAQRAARPGWLAPLLLLLGLAAGAVVIGRYIFVGGGSSAVAPAAPAQATPAQAAPAAQPTAPAPAAIPAAAPAASPDPAPAAAAPIRARVTSLHKAAESLATAPKSGVVARVYLTAERKVDKDEKLFDITHRSPGSEKSRALAAQIRKLEALAREEPEYQPFLDKARRDYDAVKEQVETVVVRASHAGVATPQVASGARVRAGDLLATTGDDRSWIARAPLSGSERPGFQWSCAIVPAGDPSGAREPCAIEQLVDSEEGAEVIVRVKDSGASWLAAEGQEHELLFEPAR